MTLAREPSSSGHGSMDGASEISLVLAPGAFGQLVEEARGSQGEVTVVVLHVAGSPPDVNSSGLTRLGHVLAGREGWHGRVGWLADGSLSVLLPRLSIERARRIAAGFERLGAVLTDQPLSCDLRVLPPRRREWSMPLSW